MRRFTASPRLAFLTTALLVALAPIAGSTPVRWPVNGHYYDAVIVPGQISWTAARDSAVARGGYLATLTTHAESDFVWSVVQGTQKGLYLGGFQVPGAAEPAGGWAWVTGEPWDYTNWHAAEPNNGLAGPPENFLMFFTIVPTVQSDWNDAGPLLDGYAIEYEQNPASVTHSPADPAGMQLAIGPNPLRGPGTIRFTLPRDGRVTITLHDLGGRRLETLLRGAFAAGPHEVAWDRLAAERLPSGVYFLRMGCGEATTSVRFVLD